MGFEQFWAAYPRKVGKLAALAIWKRIKPTDELVKQMLEALAWQRLSRQWREGYIPHPKTWLGQGRWLDEPDEQRAKPTELACPHVPSCPAPGRWACQQKTASEEYKRSMRVS